MATVVNTYGVEVDFAAALELMDDDIREAVHDELAPCSEQEFFGAYCNSHYRHFGEEFVLNWSNPTW